MTLVEEIRDAFASKAVGFRLLENLDSNYPAYAMRVDGSFGVAIPYDNALVIAEHFSGAQLHSRKRILDGFEEKTYLELTSNIEDLRNEFASLCGQFVTPGPNGVERKALVNDPLTWWGNWRKLLGNSISEKKAYDVIAEMTALYELLKIDSTVQWAAADRCGTQDIEGNENSYEVKSTIKKTGVQITVSSLQQLKQDTQKRLYLYFCRMEESMQGVSINDLVEKLTGAGYDQFLLEKELMSIGYEYGCSARNEKYKITERRKYEVDDSFPSITENSFKGDKSPEFLLEFTYTIDLSNIPYTEW